MGFSVRDEKGHVNVERLVRQQQLPMRDWCRWRLSIPDHPWISSPLPVVDLGGEGEGASNNRDADHTEKLITGREV
jgi:hypothetical protein